ncbi:MAG: thioredoxin domain-containing protein [Pseudomonadota bacterium]|nr:thioredoxin domain-containing protein [Pseudomonadota bacterium]
MIALRSRHLLLAFAAAPLALGLAACKKDTAESAAPAGSALAKIAAPAGQKWEDVITATATGGMLMGNPQAKIKLVEYGSLSCPHCARFAQEAMEPLKTEFVASGRVSYEYRSFAIHPQDIPLTVLVRCAPKESFFPLVEQIYGNFDAMQKPLEDPAVQKAAEAAGSLPPAQHYPALADALKYTDFFAARGVSVDQAHACLANIQTATQVANNAKTYGEAGVNQTPTLVLNGFQLPADQSEWPKVAEALRAAGSR